MMSHVSLGDGESVAVGGRVIGVTAENRCSAAASPNRPCDRYKLLLYQVLCQIFIAIVAGILV